MSGLDGQETRINRRIQSLDFSGPGQRPSRRVPSPRKIASSKRIAGNLARAATGIAARTALGAQDRFSQHVRRRELSGRVGRQRLAGEPVASLEHLVDFPEGPLAGAWRRAWPQDPLELQARRFEASGKSAGEAPSLTWQIVEGGFEGLEPAREIRGILQAIFWRRRLAPQ